MLEKDRKILPRDPQQLVQELNLSFELRDIRRQQKLHEQLEMSWWERGIVAVLFLAMVGFLSTLAVTQLGGPRPLPPVVDYILYGTFGLMMLALVAALELILNKLATLRRMHVILESDLLKIQKCLQDMQKIRAEDSTRRE